MIKITTNKEINLAQLDQELGGQGLCMNDSLHIAKIITIADQSKLTRDELEIGVANHVANFETSILITKVEVLKKLGITAAEAKLLLS